jgi:hypothetical protein
MVARHHPSARSSRPSGGAADGSMKAAAPCRSSSGGGCPQQTTSAHDPAMRPPSPGAARSPKPASSAVTNRSGCSERAIMACSRTATPARLGSVQASSRQAFSTARPVRLAGRPVPITSPISSRTPNGVAITSWISPPPPWVAGRWRDSTCSRPTRVGAGIVMVDFLGEGTPSIVVGQPQPVAQNQKFTPLFRSYFARLGSIDNSKLLSLNFR